MTKKLFITRAELLAAGALDCPPEWRKSLSARLPKKPAGPMLFGENDLVSTQPAGENEAADDPHGGDEFEDDE